MCFDLVSEHLQSALFQIRTLAVSFVLDQNTCSHLCFRPEHLRSALIQIRTLEVTIVSDLVSEHLQSPLFQNTCSHLCFRSCCHPLDFAAPRSLYAKHDIDSWTEINPISVPVLTHSCLPVHTYVIQNRHIHSCFTLSP